jgi:hypothetical protein
MASEATYNPVHGGGQTVQGNDVRAAHGVCAG